MWIKGCYLEGYIGIYNGTGHTTINIDFTKCKNKIVVIKGDNGSGKSTLNKALNPFNDSNTDFIPNRVAKKTIVYSDGLFDYELKYVHGLKPDGSRETAKGYIKRINLANGDVTDLNPNGNVSECKDIIFDLFNLDSNFITLSQLHTNDRGLADKRPAERKKFINAILSSVSVYNDMYKTLTKRSTIFKSMINSLSSKIDMIGDEEKLKMSLTSIDNRITNLISERDRMISSIASFKEKINILDPDGSRTNIYVKLEDQYDLLKKLTDKICVDINDRRITDNILPDDRQGFIKHFKNEIKDLNRILIDCDTKISLYKSEADLLLLSREKDAESLQEKNIKLSSLINDKHYKQLKDEFVKYKNDLENIENIFKSINFLNFDNITKNEYVLLLNLLKNVKETVENIYRNYDYGVIEESIDVLLNNMNIEALSKNNLDSIELYKSMNLETDSKIRELELDIKLSERINEVPEKCNLKNSCKFVKDIVLANVNIDKKVVKLEELYSIKKDIEIKLVGFGELNLKLYSISEVVKKVNSIYENIQLYSNLIEKFPGVVDICNYNSFIVKVRNRYNFEELKFAQSYLDYSNLIEEYKVKKDNINKIQLEINKYESRESLVEEIIKDIGVLDKKVKETTSRLFILQELVKETQELKLKKDIAYIKCEELIEKLELYLSKNKDLINLDNELESMKKEASIIQECSNGITLYNNSLNSINAELNSIKQDSDKIRYSIKLLEDYKIEIAEFKLKYDKIETIKYYTSPTTGIQTIFMESYMNKILSMANDLLRLLFDGEFILQPFVINEDEFRIPCSGSGLMNDDISSMSTSQICMISMILSFALLHHSSTKYNILKLDEIDGGLDTRNRIQFILLLNSLMEMLKCEQCIMISHNNELNLKETDIILLKNSDPEININGNVIFKL